MRAGHRSPVRDPGAGWKLSGFPPAQKQISLVGPGCRAPEYKKGCFFEIQEESVSIINVHTDPIIWISFNREQLLLSVIVVFRSWTSLYAVFWIGPFEMLIAYRLWLGSGKDSEDAIFIREISRDFIDEVLLRDFCSSFGVKSEPS